MIRLQEDKTDQQWRSRLDASIHKDEYTVFGIIAVALNIICAILLVVDRALVAAIVFRIFCTIPAYLFLRSGLKWAQSTAND